MSKLNEDVLFLILEELQNDGKSLFSCLLVNRTLCETIVPILWKNPFKICQSYRAKRMLFNVILLHLSEESRENLKNQKIELFTETPQQLLFNYISFWRYLNLRHLEKMLIYIKNIERSKIFIIKNEIKKLFINRNTKFIHLHIRSWHQIHFPGAEHCFSVLKFLQCRVTSDNQSALEILARLSKSIKTLIICIMSPNNNFSGIIKLIEAQNNLNDVKISYIGTHERHNKSFKPLEESLIKHADTLQYLQISWKPTTEILSCLINLISLGLNLDYTTYDLNCWSRVENANLPVLKILKARLVPYKSLVCLIENTRGHLNEISVDYGYNYNYNYYDWKIFTKTIYQNCPNLRYLGLHLDFNISGTLAEFETLLINCQCLSGLVLDFSLNTNWDNNWDNIFKILTKSSPTGLFKFKFHFSGNFRPKFESLKLFFDNWKCRHPILLQTTPTFDLDVIEEYKTEGIIKKYDSCIHFERFEWIQKNNLIIC